MSAQTKGEKVQGKRRRKEISKRCVRERRSIVTLSVFERRGWTTSRPQEKKNKTSIKLGFKANLSTSSKEES